VQHLKGHEGVGTVQRASGRAGGRLAPSLGSANEPKEETGKAKEKRPGWAWVGALPRSVSKPELSSSSGREYVMF
jgi:hypothetical protein